MLKGKNKKDIQRKYYLCDLSQADKHLQEQRALEKNWLSSRKGRTLGNGYAICC